MSATLDRVHSFCARFGLRIPILLAPMAGSTPPALSIAVANAGGLGACGVLLMQPAEILAWIAAMRGGSAGPFQLNTWIPDAPPSRDCENETRLRDFLAGWGPPVAPEAGDATRPDFAAQCEAILQSHPPIVSSIMGLFPPEFVGALRARKIAWFATATTVAEARAAEAAGADVIIAQGCEAGGHRGSFDPALAEQQQVGLVALVPAVVDAVRVPVVAAGGIAEGRSTAAALILGASAAVIGTAFLRCPEAQTHRVWSETLAKTAPEDTIVSRVFTGRAGRSVATPYVRAALADTAPRPAPYPVQRGLTTGMRAAAQRDGNRDRMQMWAGQSAAFAQAAPAGDVARGIWEEARKLVTGDW
jgi:nitronate monooxygenase